ncbi:transposase [Myxococcus sp. Y35]|uniref:transposase n=1 Tax=Pseudomyxococcus flavus TaxID=3115648 RepID=UPI003CE98CFC
MRRHELSDVEWGRIKPLLGSRSGQRSMRGDHDFINAVVWRVKTGGQWRNLPERLGHWKTVYNRFHRSTKTGRGEAIFKALRLDVDELGALADASVVRAHQDAAERRRPATSPSCALHPCFFGCANQRQPLACL